MNERKPTWQCPVCDKPAMYDSLMVDGYFLDVIKDPLLPSEENEIILNQVTFNNDKKNCLALDTIRPTA